jgi:hypothetical protein
MRLIISISLILIIATGCFIIKPSVKTVHLEDVDSVRPSGMIYALPQTVMKIGIEMLEIKTYKGPYYRFADKYLGISGVPEINKSRWLVKNVTLTTFSETDPDQYYMIAPIKRTFEPGNIMYLSDEGFIMDLKKLDAFAVESKKINLFNKTPGILYTNLTVTRNIEQSTDTLYKTILTDTSFIRLPVLKNEMVAKTIDERAEEAADFIIEIRNGRFELLTGQSDFYPEGRALEFAVNRLDELEEECLSLFIGKTVEITRSFEFWYIPRSGEVYENIELFEYADQKGISREITGSGKVVSLLIKKVDKTRVLDAYMTIKDEDNMNRLYYRIPDIAEVEIQDGGRPVFNDRIPVYQYGTILSMPAFK